MRVVAALVSSANRKIDPSKTIASRFALLYQSASMQKQTLL
jgi:hypothetical protein